MPVTTNKKKPFSKLLVLGQEGHGKTTFTAALSKLLASKSANKATSLEQIKSADTQKVGQEDVNFSKVEIESDKRSLLLYDFPTHSDFMNYIQDANEEIDGAILVVDAAEGGGDEIKPQLEAIKDKLKGKKNLIVFLNKTDVAEDKDQIDLSEVYIKDILTSLDLEPETVPFYRGAATLVIDSNDRKSSKPFLDFMKGVNKLPSN